MFQTIVLIKDIRAGCPCQGGRPVPFELAGPDQVGGTQDHCWHWVCSRVDGGRFEVTFSGEVTMPKGDKSSYTDKQKRKAEHIEEGYEDRGVSKKEAESRAWATVNKESGGGKKSGKKR